MQVLAATVRLTRAPGVDWRATLERHGDAWGRALLQQPQPQPQPAPTSASASASLPSLLDVVAIAVHDVQGDGAFVRALRDHVAATAPEHEVRVLTHRPAWTFASSASAPRAEAGCMHAIFVTPKAGGVDVCDVAHLTHTAASPWTRAHATICATLRAIDGRHAVRTAFSYLPPGGPDLSPRGAAAAAAWEASVREVLGDAGARAHRDLPHVWLGDLGATWPCVRGVLRHTDGLRAWSGGSGTWAAPAPRDAYEADPASVLVSGGSADGDAALAQSLPHRLSAPLAAGRDPAQPSRVTYAVLRLE